MVLLSVHRRDYARCKGVGMADFSDAEVEKMYGNKIVAKVWMANWDPSRDSKPSESDVGAVKAHLDTKYKSRQWLDRDLLALLKQHGAAAFSKHRPSSSKPKPHATLAPAPSPAPASGVVSQTGTAAATGGSADPFGSAPPANGTGGGGADPFGSARPDRERGV